MHWLASSRLRKSGELTQLDITAPLHESFLWLQGGGEVGVADRDHFLSRAAQTMRSVVVDLGRARQAESAATTAASATAGCAADNAL